MQCGTLDGILKPRGDMSGKTGETRIKAVINSAVQCEFLSFDERAVVMKHDVT